MLPVGTWPRTGQSPRGNASVRALTFRKLEYLFSLLPDAWAQPKRIFGGGNGYVILRYRAIDGRTIIVLDSIWTMDAA